MKTIKIVVLAILLLFTVKISDSYGNKKPSRAYQKASSAIQSGDINNLEKIIKRKRFDINSAQGKNDMSLLLEAANKGNVEIIELLLINGADIESRDKWHSTALIHAVCAHKTEAVKLLVARGANVNAKTHEGYTSLKIAAWINAIEITEALLNNEDVDIYAINKYGHSALSLSIKEGHSKTFLLILNKILESYFNINYWYQKSAEQGLARTQFEMGFFHEIGILTDSDGNKALYWYEKAAENIDGSLPKDLTDRVLRSIKELKEAGYSSSNANISE